MALWCASHRVPEDLQGQAVFLAKADGVLAGLAVADLVRQDPLATACKPLPCENMHFGATAIKLCF